MAATATINRSASTAVEPRPLPSAPAEVTSGPVLAINRIEADMLLVPIVGTSPLIMHRFSEKARKQMLDAMQGVKTPKTNKDPQAEYKAAMYRFADGGYGLPVISFKAATVAASRFYGKDVTQVGLRQMLFFQGEMGLDGQALARIDGEPHMREDVVKVGISGTDLRYRPQFDTWRTTLTVTFVRSALTAESVVSLIDAGGMGVGVGEWRPERKGDFGTYGIDPDREIQIVPNVTRRTPMTITVPVEVSELAAA